MFLGENLPDKFETHNLVNLQPKNIISAMHRLHRRRRGDRGDVKLFTGCQTLHLKLDSTLQSRGANRTRNDQF